MIRTRSCRSADEWCQRVRFELRGGMNGSWTVFWRAHFEVPAPHLVRHVMRLRTMLEENQCDIAREAQVKRCVASLPQEWAGGRDGNAEAGRVWGPSQDFSVSGRVSQFPSRDAVIRGYSSHLVRRGYVQPCLNQKLEDTFLNNDPKQI